MLFFFNSKRPVELQRIADTPLSGFYCVSLEKIASISE